MKAIVRTGFGSPDVLELQEVEKPVLEDGHVLVRVHAASLNLGDWHPMRGRPYIVRSIGADRVIDYTREDFTKTGQRYDLIFDVAGNHSLSACKRALKPKGTLVLAGQTGRREHSIFPLLKVPLLAPFVRYRLRSFIAKRKKEDLNTLKEYLETGKITPVIDRTYPLREVPEAMRYIGTLHARGKVVISVG